MRMSLRVILLAIAMLPGWALPAFAEDAILRDSNRCSRYFSVFEQQHAIPPKLLKAVSIVESGIYHKDSATTVPWPWTINVQGKGYFFNSKQEAIEAVQQLQARGISSIDVGCMQINLHFHPKAFISLEQAFEPRENIAYAAGFLQDNFVRGRSWRNAVASYHSETRELGMPYAKKVLAIWQQQLSNPKALAVADLTGITSSPEASSFQPVMPSFQPPVKRVYATAGSHPGTARPVSERTALIRNRSQHFDAARRNSNIFIKVRQQTPDEGASPDKVNVVEDVTQNVLHKYAPSEQKHDMMVVD